MKNFLRKMKRKLLHTVIFATVTVVVIQGTVTLSPLYFFTDWSEILPVAWEERIQPVIHPLPKIQPEPDSQAISMTISLRDIAALPACWVLVNGEKAAAFSSRHITLLLHAGDVLEIDSTHYNFPVVFAITDGDENLQAPSIHQQFQTQRGRLWLGEIQMKDETSTVVQNDTSTNQPIK